MYVKPTQEMIEGGMKWGWSKEDAERGYTIFDFNGTGLLEIEAIYDVYDYKFTNDTDITDEDCAYEAERSGFCKIIPVEELPENMIWDGQSRRWFGWVDTPENRKNIFDFFKDQNMEDNSNDVT